MCGAYGLRASDADRDRVAELVRRAVADGRLDFAELEDRLGQIYAAKTYADLVPATRDLSEALDTGESGDSEVLPRRGPSELVVAFGEQRVAGRWLAPARMSLRVLGGRLTVDFTRAGLPHRVLVDAAVYGGQLSLVVPDDVGCEVEPGPALLGRRRDRSRATGTAGFASPLIRVRGPVVLGELSIRTPRARWWRPAR